MNGQPPEYDVLEIRLSPGRDAYNVQITSASGARAHGRFVAPTQSEVEALRRMLDPRNPVRGPAPKLEAAKAFGAELFRLLVETPGVRDVYTAARNKADAAEHGLRVTLSLGAVPDLASIPWEFLYDHPRFLALHNSPVVRFVDLKDPWPPPQVKPPLRILGMVSRPKDGVLAALDAQGEQAALEQRLGPLIDSGRVTLRWLERATLRALQEEINDGDDFHIFHYIGHGEYDDESNHSSLLLEHNDGRVRHVGGLELGQVLCRHRGSLRLAVLNACDAAQTAPQDPMAGVATSLMEHGVPAVVAMQFAITDDGALTFADEFYRALAVGYDVDAAVTQARCTLAVDTGVEWGTPVLFMRQADGRLFDLPSTIPPPTPKKLARAPTDGPANTWLAALLATGRRRPEHAGPRRRPPRTRRSALLLAAVLIPIAAITAFLGLRNGRPVVKVGAIYPLTGILSDSGNDAYRGVELAVQYLNDSGFPDLGLPLPAGAGLPRLGGAKIKLVKTDSKSKRCDVETLFTGLVKDEGAAAVIGTYESTVTLQAIYAANQLKVPFVNETSTAPSFTRPDNHEDVTRKACGKSEEDPTPSPWFFRVGPNEAQAADLFRQFLIAQRARKIPVRTAAILNETADIYGESVRGATVNIAGELGVRVERFGYPTVVGQRAVKPGSPCSRNERKLASKLKSIVRKIKRLNPDIVFVGSYTADAVATLQTMRKLEYLPRQGLLAYGAGYGDSEYIEPTERGRPECGLPAANPYGVITRVAWAKNVKRQRVIAKNVAALFKQRYGAEMTSTSARAFTGMLALAQAINEARSTDATDIQYALRRLTVPASQTIMPWAGIKFDKNGQNTRADVVLEQERPGGPVVVFPKAYATHQAIWPLERAQQGP